VIYRPFLVEGSESSPPKLKFLKEINHHLPKVPAEASHKTGKADQRRTRPLRVVSNSTGLSAVFMPGASPSFVLRTLKSLPHIVELRGDFVRGFSEFKSSEIATSFAYIDSHVCFTMIRNTPRNGIVNDCTRVSCKYAHYLLRRVSTSPGHCGVFCLVKK
jgi:hypothetical protein